MIVNRDCPLITDLLLFAIHTMYNNGLTVDGLVCITINNENLITFKAYVIDENS